MNPKRKYRFRGILMSSIESHSRIESCLRDDVSTVKVPKHSITRYLSKAMTLNSMKSDCSGAHESSI